MAESSVDSTAGHGVQAAESTADQDSDSDQFEDAPQSQSVDDKRESFKKQRGVFSLLAAHPETRPSPVRPKSSDQEWVQLQRKTFTMWANSHLQGRGRPPMTDLERDMRDGVALITLLECLSNKEIGVKYHKQPKSRPQMLDNLQQAFLFMESEGIEHVSMNPNDIVDGNLKLLLGILWRLIFKYHISDTLKRGRPQSPVKTSNTTNLGAAADTKETKMETTTEKSLLSWFQASLPQFQITNFTMDWNDGVKLSALVDYCQPGLIPNWELKDPENAIENIGNATSAAHEHFQIPQIIHAEDVAVEKPDKLSMMTYLRYFCCPGSPGEKVLMDWISIVMPETKISNFTSDWKDGQALCYLVAAFAPSAIGLDELDLHSDLENARMGMEVAEKEFGIKAQFSPEQLVSGEANRLSIMTYLTKFRFIKEERRKLPYLSALGSGVTGTMVGEEAEVCVEGEELDEGAVMVRVTSPHSSELKVQEIPSRSGTPVFQYKPTVPGTYSVEVKYSGEHIKGSPYHVNHCFPSIESLTGGQGLHRACVGREAKFTVNVSTLGKGFLNLRVVDSEQEPLEEVKMETEEEGCYCVSYTPLEAGRHTIDLEWVYDNDEIDNDEEIDENIATLQTSYTVDVLDITKCVVTGNGLSRAVVDEPASFQINTTAMGSGSLSVVMTGPGNPDLKRTTITDDVYAYEYTPTEEGEYRFDIMWEMVPIPGSPFKVRPLADNPAAQCSIKKKPSGYIRLCSPVSVVVDTPDEECDLRATLTGPRTNKECNISHIEANIYTITFCPIEVGEYEMDIEYGGNKIPESPLKFEVNDPTKCWVVNPEALPTMTWHCGQKMLVRVSTSLAGKGDLVGKVQGPSMSITCNTKDGEEGDKLVCFTPTEVGQHTIRFTFDGHNILERPSKFTVVDDNLEGITITKPVSQNGSHLANKPLDIAIFAPGRDKKLFGVNASGTQTGAIPTCTLLPTGEDTYNIHFTASQPDDYRMSVHYNSKSIPGSPFTLAIRLPPCSEKVTSFDPVLPLRAGKEAIELFFNIQQAGDGSLTAKVTDSTSDDCFQLVSVEAVSHELCCVSFVPPKNETYTVNVYWSGEPVPGSPFTIAYQEQLEEPSVCVKFRPDLGLPGKLSVTSEGATSGRVPTDFRQFERGHYQISFSPPKREKYELRVFWFEKEVKGSPFAVDLTPSPPTQLPEGVHIISANVPLDQPAVVSAFAVGRKEGLVKPLKVSYAAQKGRVHIYFTDRKKDNYKLYLFWNRQLVPGSPFKIDLST